jgi:hypothetical protein
MYLKRIGIENVGPFSGIDLELPFHENGNPKPLALVGANGSGKTILLAHIADAFHEFAAKHFQDVLPLSGLSHAFFKVSGAANLRSGTASSFCFLEFQDGNDLFEYFDKGGNLTFEQCKQKLGDRFKFGQHQWADDKFTTDSTKLETILSGGVYVFFPTGRSEWPHWLNSENPEVADRFTTKRKFRRYLNKSIVVATSAHDNKQWLLDLVLDRYLYQDTILWQSANQIVSAILQRTEARLGVGHRIMGGHRVAIIDPQGNIIVPSIDHLSAGQSTLLNLCLTILRHGDRGKDTDLQHVSGVVLIDEVDAHLHTTLLHQVLPELIKLFPKIQFILTTHSPVVLMGMEKTFGENGLKIVEIPSGKELTARDFSEYKSVVNALELSASIQKTDKKAVVFVEGQTDKQIVDVAWKKLNPEKEAAFEVVNGYDCFAIQNALARENIFKNSPDKIFIGMLDFDAAYECWDRLKSKIVWSVENGKTEKDGLLIKHNNNRGFLFLLPVPDFRNNLASLEFGENSGLSIEFLFKDPLITKFIVEEKLPGGGKRPVFKDDKKQKFADTVLNLEQADFDGFKPVFDLIEQIISSASAISGNANEKR